MIFEPICTFKDIEPSLRKTIPFAFSLGNLLIFIFQQNDMYFWINISIIIGYSILYIPGILAEIMYKIRESKKYLKYL